MSHQSNPAASAKAITPSNTTVLSPATRGIYVGGDGDLVVRMQGLDGSGTRPNVTFVSVVAGTILPICVDQVLASTTATNLVALW